MKKIIKTNRNNSIEEKQVNYIPVRYIIAIMITVLEVLTIIGIVVALCYYVPYFYILAGITTFAVEIKIIASDDNPEYKIPWMLFVLILPVSGFMLYFIFSSRKLKNKYIKRLNELKNKSYTKDDSVEFANLESKNTIASSQANLLCNISESHLFQNTDVKYFASGEDYFKSLINDLKTAQKFIYIEYFIINEGKFWNSILDVLKQKVAKGVEVKVIYDDIGCMKTLPGDYVKTLKSYGIEATVFSKLKGAADSEFNNRNHRKITVIDGIIGYTGGINIADEYINEYPKYGHWKDAGVRLEGEAVWELTRLFLIDFGINVKKFPMIKHDVFPNIKKDACGYVLPFGDGPKPMYERRVSKTIIQNMLANAVRYVYITTPYLIIDNDLCTSIENASLRGVDVKIVVPHIPDKKIVFNMTKSFYNRLMSAGVKIYEYKPGFIHAKTYIADDRYAIVGTINLDYRSLVHHFENGVWLYDCECISDIKNDITSTIDKSILVTPKMLKTNLLNRFFRSLVRIFAPML